jgi:MYXO-CTERM domain-containing protein
MVYDAAHGNIVLFGGNGTASILRDTWTWDGTWTQASPAVSPPERENHAMAYDETAMKVVLFGGLDGSTSDADTWTWDGTTWAQGSPAPAPLARYSHAMATGVLPGGVVLFGGYGNGMLDDTWVLRFRGGDCTTAAECDTGHCVDGSCCQTPACGTCQACNVAAAPGVCTAVVNAPDPDSCTGAQACNAKGACAAANGQACASAAQCASGFCVDGVCCGTATCPSCQACSNALTGKPSGTCADVIAGKTHGSDCQAEPPATCARDGTCDGEGGCRNYVDGTSCGSGALCMNGSAIGTLCDGLGHCGSKVGAVPCGAYACQPGSGCFSTCDSSLQCSLGNYCNGGICVPQLAAGAACTGDLGCPLAAPYCVDGVCCNTKCPGQCEACNEPEELGTCVPVVGAPRAGRMACPVSSTSNVCAAAQCDGITRVDCQGFVDSRTSCRAASCTAGVATAAANCNGHGDCEGAVTSTCAPYVCRGVACGMSCQADADCATNFRCDTPNGKCVSQSAASCDGMHTLTAPDGTKTDCSPYACAGTLCNTTCHSVLDCVFPAECTSDGTCMESAAGPPGGSSGGCGCVVGPARGGPRAAFALFGLVALGVARRRGSRGRKGGRQVPSRPSTT